MQEIIDITVGLATDVAPWPGDNPLVWDWPLRLGPHCPINLSHLAFSPHLGTHVDAPLHFLPGGETAETIPLESLIGPCLVLSVASREERGGPITVDMLCPQLTGERVPPGPWRLLLHTGYLRKNPFNREFRYLCPASIDWLAAQGVVLLGSDAPSLDHISSKTLDSHHRCYQHGITILENLNLAGVNPGWYQLVALPLLVPGGEATPARAVLLKG